LIHRLQLRETEEQHALPIPPQSLPNIVVLTVDTLRADHLGCYGYDRPTSPHIDTLAAESVVFENAFAAGIPTMPSFTTLLTGLHPYRHGIVSHIGERRLSDEIMLLPQLAKAGGYLTIACDNLVVQGEGTGSWFARGYDHYSGFLYRPFGDQSRQLTDRALSFLDKAPKQPFLLFMHYWDPHTPYGPLQPYDTLHYVPGAGPVDMADVRRIHPEYYDLFVGDMKLREPDDYAYIVAQYDGEITQVDAQIGRLLSALRQRGDWDNTIVLLLADHGECFGEGEFFFDHHGLYDAVTRVACTLRVPDQPSRRIDALVSTEDILPTLSDLAGFSLPPYQLTGHSLGPLLTGAADEIRPFVVSAEATRQASLALRTPEWKLIMPIVQDAQGCALPDFYGRARPDEPSLFDLRPGAAGEVQDVARHHPEQLASMNRMLETWRAAMQEATDEPDPILAQGLSLPFDRFMARMFGRK